jgi:hypothetical protein
VVLDKIVTDAPKQVDLQTRYRRAPRNSRNAHKVGLAASGRAAVKNLGRRSVERYRLLLVKLKV